MVLALGPGWALLKVGLALLGVLGALALVGRRVRSRDPVPPGAAVRLTAQHSVHVVDVEGRRLLVGVGPSGAPRLLCDLDPPEPPAAPAAWPASRQPRVGWDGD